MGTKRKREETNETKSDTEESKYCTEKEDTIKNNEIQSSE